LTTQSLQLENAFLAERYLIRRPLTHGRYAELHEAFDRKQQRTVIIKALNIHLRGVPEQALEQTLIYNFKQECQVQKLLKHPHIVELLDEGTAANRDGITYHYIVLEYLSGGDLESACKGKPLSLREALHYVGQIVSALALAHEKEIIHRDLKPANFLLSGDRKNIKIADFGVARFMPKGSGSLITRVGTPIYSPPEHNPDLNTNFDKLTAASDVYSLAKTIYTALAGRAPSQFRAQPIDTLPPELLLQPWGPKLLSVLQRATANEVSERHQAIKDFWESFSALAHVDGTTSPAPDPPRRKRLVIDLQPIKTRTLELITLNEAGKIIAKKRGEASYFVEDLGNGVGIEMIRVPSGRFLMGSPGNESERSECEGPQHWVNVESFMAGRFPVTQQQWREVARWSPVKSELDPDPSIFKGEFQPVESISWHDAVEFCQRLSRRTGRKYRLPSEAEWEYSCRAGSLNPFCFGDTILPALANFDSSLPYKSALKGVARNETVRVDQFSACNAFGMVGMHGNVWEWCSDTWHENYVGAPVDGSPWMEGGVDGLRVVRGGSWFNAAWLCRSAYRYAFAVNTKGHNCGFRVAADA